MLGARTKEVRSYGRHNKRIINVSDDRPYHGGAVDEDTKRSQNPIEQDNLARTRTLSTITSPAKPAPAKAKRPQGRVMSHVSPVVLRKKPVVLLSKVAAGKKADLAPASLPRTPLGLCSTNVPGSPAIRANMRKRLNLRPNTAKRTTSALSPYVDVEIVVTDDRGHRLSQERRVVRPGAQVNPIVSESRNVVQRTTHSIHDNHVDSRKNDDFPELVRCLGRRRGGRRVVLSDGSDEEFVAVVSSPDIQRTSPNLRRSSRHGNSNEEYFTVPSSPDDPLSPPKLGRGRRCIVESDDSDEEYVASSSSDEPRSPPRLRRGRRVAKSNKLEEYAATISAPDIPQTPPKQRRGGTRMVKSDNLDEELLDVSPLPGVLLSPRLSKPSVTAPIMVSPDESPESDMDRTAMPSHRARRSPRYIRPPLVKPCPVKPQLQQPPNYQRTLVSHLPSSFSFHARPRPLTPIKRGQRPPPSPSPSTSSSLGLSIDLEDLSLSPSLALKESEAQPPFLLPLLDECEQDRPHEFSAFIEAFPFDPIVYSTHGRNEIRFRKIGEASYSEVFGIGDVVLKVIPIRLEGGCGPLARCAEEGPPPSDAKDILKEMIVTRAMGETCDGFVQLLRGYVVRGRYPSLLLDLWDEYAQFKGSESIRPDCFSVSQLYAIIVLPNGGPDLETYIFSDPSRTGWRQACSIFWQVAKALAKAEELVSFEHRDLHWGQILVKNLPLVRIPKLSAQTMDDPSHGVKATLIDLGLSRMDACDDERDGVVHWTPFDEDMFEGEGDYQFDIYRMVRSLIGKDWQSFRPLTNVMWLHYLSVKLLDSKRLNPPAGSACRPKTRTPQNLASTVSHPEKICWEAIVEVEQQLRRCVEPYRTGKQAKGKRGVGATKGGATDRIKSAKDVRDWGVSKGWICR